MWERAASGSQAGRPFRCCAWGPAAIGAGPEGGLATLPARGIGARLVKARAAAERAVFGLQAPPAWHAALRAMHGGLRNRRAGAQIVFFFGLACNGCDSVRGSHADGAKGHVPTDQERA